MTNNDLREKIKTLARSNHSCEPNSLVKCLVCENIADAILSAVTEHAKSIPEKTTRGYLDSSDEWLEAYQEGRKDFKNDLIASLGTSDVPLG